MLLRICLLLAVTSFVPLLTRAGAVPPPRPFHVPDDALSYPNELLCEYELDPATGQMHSHRRVPKPHYALHCFVVARTALQFYDHARFEPNEPKATSASYRHLVRLVLARSPRSLSSPSERVVIPGYASLHEFSGDYETLLKSESGGAWQSYVQRGNWRMVFPFSRRHQEHTAKQVIEKLRQGRAVPVHLVCFPAQTINHVLLLIDATEQDRRIDFLAYDPNEPSRPATLAFDRATRRFVFGPNNYFPGSSVKVYEIYQGLLY